MSYFKIKVNTCYFKIKVNKCYFKTKKIGLFKIQTKTQQKQDKILENKSQIWTHGRAMFFLQYMHYNLIHNMRCFTVFTNRCALVVQEKL